MKKFAFFALLMFSIFSCFSKKKPASENVETALERMFPGKYKVLDTNLKMLDIMAQLKGQKQALVADQADPEVQFLLDWLKGSENAGFEPSTVTAAHERALRDVAQARELYKALKNKGMDKFSVGVIDQAAYVQAYLEPLPEARKQLVATVKSVLDARTEQAQSSIFIEIMEDSVYQAEFKEIIPRGHWETGRGWQNEHLILSLDFEWNKDLEVSELLRHWEINTQSRRNMQYSDRVFQEARAWAEKNLPKPWDMAMNRPYRVETLENSEPTVQFAFPYYDQKLSEDSTHLDPEPKGYVVGSYHFDRKQVSALQKKAEY